MLDGRFLLTGERTTTPYEQGMQAALRWNGSWLDCPYSSFDRSSRHKYLDWMAGWDFIKKGAA